MSSGFFGALKGAADAVKRSPQVARRGLQRMGNFILGKPLVNTGPNGWVHTDEAMAAGVHYKVTYLGSVEVDFHNMDTAENQKMAETAMEQLMDYTKGQGTAVDLCLNPSALVLSDPDKPAGEGALMHHSTLRITYSTVDHKKRQLFAYVALVRHTNQPLLHVFRAKSAREGMELTLSCAQAFHAAHARFKEHGAEAHAAALAEEQATLEPRVAWQKKHAAAAAAAAAADGPSDAAERQAKRKMRSSTQMFMDHKQEEDEVKEHFGFGTLVLDEKFGFEEAMKRRPRDAAEATMLELGINPEMYNATVSESTE